MSSSQLGYRKVDEWIQGLIDPGSLVPLFAPRRSSASNDAEFGSEITAGLATVKSRPIAFYAIDPQVKQGYITSQGAIKIQRIMKRALDIGVPLVAFLASPGISIEEGVISGDEYTRVIMSTIECSGQIPQLAIITSVVMGGGSYAATLMDLTFFNRLRSHMMVSGPSVVASALGEKTTLSQLGGAEMHSTKTGLAHFVDQSIPEQLERVKWMISFLPSNYREDPPVFQSAEPAEPIPAIPSQPMVPFDMSKLIRALVDGSEMNEYLSDYGLSLITGFARMGGYSIGIVANQSLHLGGAIDTTASNKASRFIRLCDSYSIPIVTLIDVPGYLPGSIEEQNGLLKHGATLCRSMHTRVPKMSVVVRRCYGAAAFVMLQGSAQKGDLVLAIENCRIAVMGFDAAKEIVYKNQIQPHEIAEYREKYYRDHERPEIAYQTGLIDQIISVDSLRSSLITHLHWNSRQRLKPGLAVRGVSP